MYKQCTCTNLTGIYCLLNLHLDKLVECLLLAEKPVLLMKQPCATMKHCIVYDAVSQCQWLDNESRVTTCLVSTEGRPTWHRIDFLVAQRSHNSTDPLQRPRVRRYCYLGPYNTCCSEVYSSYNGLCLLASLTVWLETSSSLCFGTVSLVTSDLYTTSITMNLLLEDTA